MKPSCVLNRLPGHKTNQAAGAGPVWTGLHTAAQCGHQVTLFDAADQIGGQFNLARQIPGKREFNETLRYFRRQLELQQVTCGCKPMPTNDSDFDQIIFATGTVPRTGHYPVSTIPVC
ncbi:MAG: FAD/NAD(P)-binding oxidoreductase [Thiolinea sp.]